MGGKLGRMEQIFRGVADAHAIDTPECAARASFLRQVVRENLRPMLGLEAELMPNITENKIVLSDF